MTLLRLNNDVLYLIFSYLSSNEAAMCALACHLLYDLALPRMISRVGYPSWRSAATFRSFCMFASAREYTCTLFLQDLCLANIGGLFNTMDSIKEILPFIIDLLRSAKNLRCLDFDSLEQLLSLDARIGDAVQALPRLQSLKITLGTHTYSFMTFFRTPLRSVTLRTIPFFREAPFSIWALLANFRDFLEELHLSGGKVNDNEDGMHWPLMQNLTISYAIVMAPVAQSLRPILSRAFPQLQSLTLSNNKYMNEIQQHEDLIDSATWQSLDFLDISAAALPMLRITCPVRKMVLPSSQALWLHNAVSCVQACKTTVLRIRLPIDLPPNMVSHLAKACTHLRYLTMEFCGLLPKEDWARALSAWKSKIPAVLSTLPVHALCILLDLPGRDVPQGGQDALGFCPILAMSITSLRYISVEPATSTPQAPRKWWRITRYDAQTEPYLEQLTMPMSRTIEDALDHVDYTSPSWVDDIDHAYRRDKVTTREIHCSANTARAVNSSV